MFLVVNYTFLIFPKCLITRKTEKISVRNFLILVIIFREVQISNQILFVCMTYAHFLSPIPKILIN